MFESLESRRLLAAAPSLVYTPGFSLTVNGGTDGGTMIVREETPTAGSPGPYTYFVELRDVNGNVLPGHDGTTPYSANAVSIVGAGKVDRITFTGYSKGAVITGGTGNDIINVTDADHPDASFVRSVGSSVDGGRGADTIEIGEGFTSTVNGGDDNDIIRITDAVAIIDPSTGNVSGYDMTKGGHSVVDGGAGNDTITILAANHTRASGGDGTDLIQVNSAAIGGGVNLSSAVAEIFGDKGNDTIYLFDGQNTVDGGAGKDSLYVAAAVDSVTVVPGTVEKTGTA
jgi:Ca2+-binding RTX toxin-like protein